MPTKYALLITCEHGGNRIPASYQPLFLHHAEMLASHRGYDPGALPLARELAAAFQASLFYATVSRLVVDLNRSIGHPNLYSAVTRATPPAVRREILERHYLPYRRKAEAAIADLTAQGFRVIHIAAHSFTPVLDSVVRNADVGLLYDPGRPGEAQLCRRWQSVLNKMEPTLKVRRNYPYRGKADGFTAYLRRRIPAESYVGIELEVNQRHVVADGLAWPALRHVLARSLHRALSEDGGAAG